VRQLSGRDQSASARPRRGIRMSRCTYTDIISPKAIITASIAVPP